MIISIKSTQDRYGSVAVSVHWATVVLLVGLVVSGLAASATLEVAVKAVILRAHVAMGLAAGVLTLFRLVWWWFFDTKPAPVRMPRGQIILAKLVQALLCVVVLAMVASGVALVALSGAVPLILGSAGATLPDFSLSPLSVPHSVSGFIVFLAGLTALHVAGALYHHFVRRDGLLRRMWRG